MVTEYGALVAVLLFLTPLDEYCVPFLLEEEEEEEEEEEGKRWTYSPPRRRPRRIRR